MKASTLKAVAPICKLPGCGKPAYPDRRGRPRIYCSNKCKMLAIKLGAELPALKHQFDLKYCNEYIFEYIKYCEDVTTARYVEIPGPNALPVGFKVLENVVVPSIAGYSMWLYKAKGVFLPRETLNYWNDTKPAFTLACNWLRQAQEVMLSTYGLSNRTNPIITKMHLEVNHKWVVPEAPKVVNNILHAQFEYVKNIYNKVDVREAEMKEKGIEPPEVW
jgi:hypothetical protein